ncbi:hypothetical protein Ocin01_02372, partial [Orchesella cincta]
MKNILVLFALCNVVLLANGFDATFENSKDGKPAFGWKTSKSRPFRYFKSLSEIDEAFLPVHTDSLPDGDGIWILRYKDASHLPLRFASNDGDPSKAFIKYSTTAQLFNKITIKALSVGDVELGLTLGSSSDKQRLSLSAIKNCSEDSDTATSSTDGFRWTTYEVYTASPSSHVAAEVLISHPKSFFMLDEMSVSTGNYPELEDKKFDDENEESKSETGNFRIFCKSID